MTDLRQGQVGHGLGLRVFVVPPNFFPWPLIINLKFAKVHRGTASKITLKRAKMLTYGA